MAGPSATLAQIQSADWSLMLDSTASLQGLASGLGYVVEGVDDVAQAIGIILTTPKGSDPFRPDFACDIIPFIDLPIDRATAHMVREITAALVKWEPRIDVSRITVAPVIDGSAQSGARLNVTVAWRLKLGGAPSPERTVRVSV